MIACFYMPQIGIAVERSRLNHLWGAPVGLAAEDGVLAAVSDEAAMFGIEPGQDAAGARALCTHLTVLPYDRPAYEEAAHCVWDLFAIESSFVEPVSPEVCFIELVDSDAIERSQQIALDLASRVRIPVRVGLAHSKFVARKAAERTTGDTGKTVDRRQSAVGSSHASRSTQHEAQRPDDPTTKRPITITSTSTITNVPNAQGPTPSALLLPTHRPADPTTLDELFLRIPSGKEARFLARIPIDGVPGLDYKTRQKLGRLGVRTFGDVLKLPKRELTRQLKELGYVLYRLARGQDYERVRPSWPPRRLEDGIEFEDETCEEPTVREALRVCSESIARTLSRKREFCRSLALRVKLADGSWLEESEKLAVPVDSVQALHAASLRLLKRIPLDQALLGIHLRAGDLGVGSGLQLALVDENRHGTGLPHERNRSLEATLTFLRKRFGPGAVVSAAMMRQARRIGLWTYPLGHLLNEPVQVATDERGRPLRYWRRGRPREIKRIHDRWRESEWFWGGIHEKTVYRVETDPSGLCELQSLGSTWRLSGLAD